MKFDVSMYNFGCIPSRQIKKSSLSLLESYLCKNKDSKEIQIGAYYTHKHSSFMGYLSRSTPVITVSESQAYLVYRKYPPRP